MRWAEADVDKPERDKGNSTIAASELFRDRQRTWRRFLVAVVSFVALTVVTLPPSPCPDLSLAAGLSRMEPTQDFMTTREVAEYLRIKERQVYELVRRRAIPCTRVTGKWLFPKRLIDVWVSESVAGASAESQGRPPVIAGSHDPLLDWAVRESECGLALLADGSLDGIARFARGEALIAGIHLLDPESGEYNAPAVREANAGREAVLIEWAWREQGLVTAPGNPKGIRGVADLAAGQARVARRQDAAGSQLLLAHLLEQAGVGLDALVVAPDTARGETDLGLMILEGRADVGLAVEAVARQLKLDFVPLARERFDLLIGRRDFFEAAPQRLLAFARTEAFHARAAQLGGYDVSGLGTVRYNGP